MADIRNPCWKKEHTTKTVRSVLNQHHKLMSATACTDTSEMQKSNAAPRMPSDQAEQQYVTSIG